MLAAAHLLPEPRKGIQEKDALRQCLWDMIVRRIDPLTKSSDRRVTSDQLRAEWNIVVQKLDLATGQPEHGETFIRPIPLHQIDSWIKEFRPLEAPNREPKDYDLFGIYDPFEHQPEGRETARGIGRMVDNYTTSSHPSKDSTMLYKTNWREGSHASKRLSFGSDIHNWVASTMMYQRDPATSEYSRHRSPTLTHLGCFVYDDEMIRDDGSLSHAELTTIMVLAVQQAHYRIYRHAAVIPIVVFSCSGRQVRIVQGCIDFRHYNFDVRCSEILDFNEGGIRGTDENLQRFYTLLGWVLGEPVGNIEKYQCDVSRH